MLVVFFLMCVAVGACANPQAEGATMDQGQKENALLEEVRKKNNSDAAYTSDGKRVMSKPHDEMSVEELISVNALQQRVIQRTIDAYEKILEMRTRDKLPTKYRKVLLQRIKHEKGLLAKESIKLEGSIQKEKGNKKAGQKE